MHPISHRIALAGLVALASAGCNKVTVVADTAEPVLIIVGHPPAAPPVPEPPPPPPPPPPPKVTLMSDAIRIDEAITFVGKSAQIEPAAYAVLDELVAVLEEHPRLTKISIEAHTDGEGSGAKNKKLTLEQAKAVRDYLVERGIDVARLKVQGRGESEPLVAEDAEGAAAANRRVEIVILKQEPAEEEAP